MNHKKYWESTRVKSAYRQGYEKGRNDAIDDLEYILHQKDLKLELNQALSIYSRFMNKCNEVTEQLKEQNN